MPSVLGKWLMEFRGHGRMRRAAWKLLLGGQFGEARTVIELGSRKFPSSISFKILQARYALLSNDREAAELVLAAINGRDPEDVFDLFELAETNRLLRRYRSAIKQFELVQRVGKLDLPILASQRLSSIHDRLGQPEKALAASVRCIELGGWQRQALLIQLGEECPPQTVEQAIKDLRGFRCQHSDGEIERLKFIAYLAAGINHWDTAIESIGLATKVSFLNGPKRDVWDDSHPPLRPTVLVIGAMKSGTSTLFEQLASHPNFVMPFDKELQFFGNRSWPKEFYYEHFPRVPVSAGYITGEASPGYYALDVMDRVKQMLPDVKIVFIKRNPVDRAVSHLFHNRKAQIQEHPSDILLRGRDKVLDLCSLNEPELSAKLRDVESGHVKMNRYLLLGCYELFMKRWRMSYAPSRLFEMEFGDFVSQPQEIMNGLFEFLDLPKFQVDASHSSNAGRYKANTAELIEIKNSLARFYEDISRALGQ